MRISESCYAITGLGCESPWTVNAGCIVGTNHTLIIDTGSNTLAAKTIYGYAMALNPSGELMVINTEKHLDHIGGNYFFRQHNIPVYGHAGIYRREEDLEAAIEDFNLTIQNPVRRAHSEGRVFYHQTHIANPNRPIHTEQRIDLGGREVEIIFTPGHTRTNLSVYLAGEGVIFCGDCLVSDYIPNLESGTAQDWQIWLTTLDIVESLKPKMIVPGHGEVLEGGRIVEEIERLRQILKVGVEKGMAPTLL